MAYRERCPECGKLDPPPVKECANETCGREFRAGEGGNPHAIYCSKRCGNAQYQRNRRRREKMSS